MSMIPAKLKACVKYACFKFFPLNIFWNVRTTNSTHCQIHSRTTKYTPRELLLLCQPLLNLNCPFRKFVSAIPISSYVAQFTSCLIYFFLVQSLRATSLCLWKSTSSISPVLFILPISFRLLGLFMLWQASRDTWINCMQLYN